MTPRRTTTVEVHHYLCPNCDEWILDDDFPTHAEACRAPRSISDLTESEVYDLVDSRTAAHPQWHRKYAEVAETVERIKLSYQNELSTGYRFNFMVPRMKDSFVVAGPPLQATMNVKVDTIHIRLPPNLKPEEVEALAWEQLLEAWDD